MDMSTTMIVLTFTLPILILAVRANPVLTDSCTTDGLQWGRGAAVSNSNTNTFGCRNRVCASGSNGYHVILQGNQDNTRWQKVEVNLKEACVGSGIKLQDTVLFLMSGVPVTWVLTGFKPSVVYLVGAGVVVHESGERGFETHEITVDQRYHLYLRLNKIPTTASVQTFKDALKNNHYDVNDFGWPFTQQAPASINYAWKATSFTLTVGEGCCLTSPYPSTTIRWWWQRSTMITELPVPTTTSRIYTSVSEGPNLRGIASAIGAVIGLVILTIIISIVCCCRKGKRVRRMTTTQTNQLNTVNGVQRGAPRTAGVSHLGAVASPNAPVQSHPTAIGYPAAGPAASLGYPEQPPAYNDTHPIKPPSYSQVIRENNHRVEPSAPTLHK